MTKSPFAEILSPLTKRGIKLTHERKKFQESMADILRNRMSSRLDQHEAIETGSLSYKELFSA
jgi:hypothetical protein